MNKRVKYFSFAIAIVAVASIMIVAIYAATSASAGISASVSWTATEGVTFELEAWVVNNASHNGIGNTTTPKSITKQIVTSATTNQTAGNIIGELNCGFYDGTNDGVNNPSDIVFTYKIKNTGSNVLKVTATKTPKNQNESGTTADNHKPAVTLSSKLDSLDNTSSCISSIIGSGFNITAGKTLEYIVTLSMTNPDLSISSFDAGVTFNFGVVTAQAGTPTIYVNGVAQTGYAVEGATTVRDYINALDGSQYPGYFYDEDLTIYADEDDIVTSETKLYTKPATLDKLSFTSNGDGTCSVEANSYSIIGEVILPEEGPNGDLVTTVIRAGFSDPMDDYTVRITSFIANMSLRKIGYDAFSGCYELEKVILGNNIVEIGSAAFKTTGIKSIIIPSNLTKIYGETFAYCNSLTNVTIPDSVTYIDDQSFRGCNTLQSLYIPNTVTALTATGGVSSAPFYNCSSSLKIYCGESSKPSGWDDYWNYYNDSNQLSVTWGVTRAQYEAQYA